MTSLAPHGDAVRLLVSGEPDLLADVTPAAVAELGLAPGRAVWLSVKETAVRTYAADRAEQMAPRPDHGRSRPTSRTADPDHPGEARCIAHQVGNTHPVASYRIAEGLEPCVRAIVPVQPANVVVERP